MVQPWMRWCRLCAREHQESYNNSHINVSIKDEEGLPLSDTIYKCFSIDIKSCENFPNVKICIECYNHIRTTINLNQRIPKVTAMLRELLAKTEEKEFDLNQIKIRHNLESDFKIFTTNSGDERNGIAFEADDTLAENEIIYYQTTELDPINMKIEEEDESECNYDNLQSSDYESSESTSSEKKPKRIGNVKKKKYKSKQVRLSEDKLKPHFCSECQKGFFKFFNYRRHMKIEHKIHVEKEQSHLICVKCGQKCRSASALTEHEFTHADERTFKCTKCEKAFKTSLSLRQHEETHNETKYICVICGLQLKTQQTLQKHMVVHSDEKKFKCDYCGNEYKRGKALKAHLILHTGLRPYTCDFCDKTFANVSNCRGHKKKQHPVQLAALEASGKNKNSNTRIPNMNELKAITARRAEILKSNNEDDKSLM